MKFVRCLFIYWIAETLSPQIARGSLANFGFWRNYPPIFSTILKTTTIGSVASGSISIPFTVSATGSFSCSAALTGTSSNTGLVSNGNINFSGMSPNCTALLTTTAGAFGSVTITLNAVYGSASATQLMSLVVIAPPNVAFSLRKIVGAYTGKAVNVQSTASGTPTQDIGFTSSGGLDTASLLSFIGTNSGFVRIWYDQSGNANNLSQATAATQPRIVNAGNLDVDATLGNPTIKFFSIDGGPWNSLVLTTPMNNNTATLSSVLQWTKPGSQINQFILSDTAANTYYWHGSGNNSLLLDGGYPSSSVLNANTLFNGVAYTGSTTPFPSSLATIIFVPTSTSSTYWNNIGQDRTYHGIYGLYSELIAWSTAISSTDQTNVYNFQRAFYGTP